MGSRANRNNGWWWFWNVDWFRALDLQIHLPLILNSLKSLLSYCWQRPNGFQCLFSQLQSFLWNDFAALGFYQFSSLLALFYNPPIYLGCFLKGFLLLVIWFQIRFVRGSWFWPFWWKIIHQILSSYPPDDHMICITVPWNQAHSFNQMSKDISRERSWRLGRV